MNFHLPFFKHKEGWYSRYVFHMFAGCEFTAKNGWILKHVFHMFAGCKFTAKSGWIWGMFFICLQDVNLWQRMVEFWSIFFICLQDVNFWWWIDVSRYIFHTFLGVCFSYVYGGMNFRQRKREMISKIKKVTFVTLVIYFVRNSNFMC